MSKNSFFTHCAAALFLRTTTVFSAQQDQKCNFLAEAAVATTPETSNPPSPTGTSVPRTPSTATSALLGTTASRSKPRRHQSFPRTAARRLTALNLSPITNGEHEEKGLGWVDRGVLHGTRQDEDGGHQDGQHLQTGVRLDTRGEFFAAANHFPEKEDEDTDFDVQAAAEVVGRRSFTDHDELREGDSNAPPQGLSGSLNNASRVRLLKRMQRSRGNAAPAQGDEVRQGLRNFWPGGGEIANAKSSSSSSVGEHHEPEYKPGRPSSLCVEEIFEDAFEEPEERNGTTAATTSILGVIEDSYRPRLRPPPTYDMFEADCTADEYLARHLRVLENETPTHLSPPRSFPGRIEPPRTFDGFREHVTQDDYLQRCLQQVPA
eukprot:GSA120T00024356001.1